MPEKEWEREDGRWGTERKRERNLEGKGAFYRTFKDMGLKSGMNADMPSNMALEFSRAPRAFRGGGKSCCVGAEGQMHLCESTHNAAAVGSLNTIDMRAFGTSSGSQLSFLGFPTMSPLI